MVINILEKIKELLKEEKEFLTDTEYEKIFNDEYKKLEEEENYFLKIGRDNKFYTFMKEEIFAFNFGFDNDIEIFDLSSSGYNRKLTKRTPVFNITLKGCNKTDNFINFIMGDSLFDVHINHLKELDYAFKGHISSDSICDDNGFLEFTIREV